MPRLSVVWRCAVACVTQRQLQDAMASSVAVVCQGLRCLLLHGRSSAQARTCRVWRDDREKQVGAEADVLFRQAVEQKPEARLSKKGICSSR